MREIMIYFTTIIPFPLLPYISGTDISMHREVTNEDSMYRMERAMRLLLIWKIR
ncbi:hypothetical protein WN51_09009 [Melipona quadrifasciata]|uniref:Uncharacterized protein n=1 Tax=Melipona quadrifasciata TaxID=166423 RepID=A0A0M9A9Q2_9HYME|nr:hypothetical protein WN51_09009 [Melipona quadrifasciata]